MDAASIARYIADESVYANHGLRIVDDAAEAVVGTVLAPSRRWDDGEPTGDVLDGTSVLTCHDEASVARALRLSRTYVGRYLLLVASSRCGSDYCADPGEGLLVDPVVVAVIDREAP